MSEKKLKTTYDPEIIKKIKAIKGYWWHKDGKYWTMDDTRKDIKKMKKLKNTYKN